MKYGCIGEKLSHSFSKEIHARLASYEYEICPIERDKVDAFMRARDFCAINVTIPYKETVLPYLDEISDIARKIGAVNTIVNRNGKLYGYNTDYFGMMSLVKKAGIDPTGKKVLVLGSGGTSKTAISVFKDMGARAVLRVSRTFKEDLIDYECATREHSDADVIVNTTPVGMYPNIDSSPIDLDCFPNVCGVIDAVYNPLHTTLIENARRKGIRAEGGLYMLVAQAVRAVEIFLDKEIPSEKTLEVYRDVFKSRENIVLVGMASCGKSTIGKLLSEKMGRRVIDTDSEIISREKRDIKTIFETDGEEYFRRVEAEVVKDVSAETGVIISTGGGVVLNRENVFNLSKNGRIYFINRSLDLLTPTSSRPLSSDRQALEKRFYERLPIYKSVSDKEIQNNAFIKDALDEISEDFLNENTCS